MSCAQCLLGLNWISLGKFPSERSSGQPLCTPEKEKCVLSDVKMIGITVTDCGVSGVLLFW